MTGKLRSRRSIERVLNAMEESILGASDEEILDETRAANAAAGEVRALIKQQIQLRNEMVPREPGARRRLLQSLLRTRPSLASTMRVSFSDTNTPSDDEVDEIIRVLIRRGVIKNKNS
jgi:hypothetical protein